MMLAGPVKTSDGPGPGRPKVSLEDGAVWRRGVEYPWRAR